MPVVVAVDDAPYTTVSVPSARLVFGAGTHIMPPKNGWPEAKAMGTTMLLVRVAGGASVMRYRWGESSEKKTTLELAVFACGTIITVYVRVSWMLLLRPDAAPLPDAQLPHVPATVDA
jgi:hypothetical protein